MNIWNEIKNNIKTGSHLTRLLYINLAFFVVVRLTLMVFTLFNVDVSHYVRYAEIPAYLPHLIYQPWSIITYMFLHIEFLHFIFNILALYWFGKIYLLFFNQRQLVGTYIVGGIGGALLYIIGYNIFPYFSTIVQQSYLLGASASVMSIIFAAVAYAPNYEISLALIGKIKLKYLGIIFLAIDLLSVTSVNAGGSIAHIGGALSGFLFTFSLQKGKDITMGINKLIDIFANIFTPRPKIKVKYTNKKTDAQWNTKKKANNEKIDEILDQIKKSGYENLTAEQKKTLFDISKKI